MWKDVIMLGQQTEAVVNYEVTKSWDWHQVYANKKSVRQSEAYQAAAVGLKPELMFEVRSIDYEQEERVEFNGKLYEILRVYDRGEVTELTVSAMTGSEI